ncbi:cysteine hydrolase family protein [uncultured Thiothrix sp.]|uniref:cysteine hydrolase family protein n=1 Tax=uncultured Thiothrix sp. TaxID=223185 RepID=UPI00261ADFD1|nr:cysteine hydrolase family protein [uncultured Thiothrix sp.]
MKHMALMVIDMQQCMSKAAISERNNPEAENQIQSLLAAWRQRQWPIIHLRHISREATSVFRPGQAGAAFQAEFEPLSQEQVFEKNRPDAFSNTGIERWLHVRELRHLAIVGVSTNNSVEASARSAGNLGFITYVVADACFTFPKVDYQGILRSADEVHAMSLANLAGEYAEIITTSDLLKLVPSL